MLRLRTHRIVFALISVVVAVFLPSVFLAQTAASAGQAATTQTVAPKAASTQSKQHHSSKRSKKAPEPEVVQPPAPPPTPEQMAPVAPNVTYQGGQLAIESKNATLAQVLRSVQIKTGASFEIPPSANNERVVAQLGPGQPREVLTALLNGSKFDYIMLGVPSQPGAVQKLILTVRQNTPITTNTAQNRPVQQPQEDQGDEDYTPPEPAPVEDNSADNQNVQPPGPGPYRPGGFVPNQGGNPNVEFPPQSPPDQQVPQQPGAQSLGVKTPEQLLQELNRMQQQQQQYQQQLNPANQNLPPNYPPQQ